MQAVGPLAAVEHMAALRDARHPEIVGPAAERQDEAIVAEPAFPGDLGCDTIRRGERRHHDLARSRFHPRQGARDEAVAVAVRVREVAEFLLARVEEAGRDLVKARLPDIRRRAVDERHLRPPGSPADGSPETRRQLEAARAAADDHDAGPAGVARRAHGLVLRPAPGRSLRPPCPQRCAVSQSGAT